MIMRIETVKVKTIEKLNSKVQKEFRPKRPRGPQFDVTMTKGLIFPLFCVWLDLLMQMSPNINHHLYCSWQIGGDNMFEMMYEANFTYDSSMPIYENRPPAFPYTLDYKMPHDCMIPPCPEKSYPGKKNFLRYLFIASIIRR